MWWVLCGGRAGLVKVSRVFYEVEEDAVESPMRIGKDEHSLLSIFLYDLI